MPRALTTRTSSGGRLSAAIATWHRGAQLHISVYLQVKARQLSTVTRTRRRDGDDGRALAEAFVVRDFPRSQLARSKGHSFDSRGALTDWIAIKLANVKSVWVRRVVPDPLQSTPNCSPWGCQPWGWVNAEKSRDGWSLASLRSLTDCAFGTPSTCNATRLARWHPFGRSGTRQAGGRRRSRCYTARAASEKVGPKTVQPA